MFNKLFLLVCASLLSLVVSAQKCNIKIRGAVNDFESNHSLRAVNIYIKELQRGTRSDSLGHFEFDQLCGGDYHIVLTHVGCESKEIFIKIFRDTTLHLTLDHSVGVLNKVVVQGKKIQLSTQHIETINERDVTDQSYANLSNILNALSGVSTLKNGNGIAKPIVHGLYGNRLTILNNGVAQSGQQWGNDHSPEIDPLIANKIRVIKGAAALEYPGVSLGSVILIEPQRILNEPHLHGKASYFFETNGRGHAANIQLQQYNKSLAWKVTGAIKKTGDKRTSSYFLNNTGNEEVNLAVQLEKQITNKLFSDFYFSTFNTSLGILRGSHIGNITDLEQAFTRPQPFFTDSFFSYAVDAPKQKVQHHLLKLHSTYLHKQHVLELTLSGQINNRKEFDVRRSGRTDVPALSLLQYSFYSAAKHKVTFGQNWSVRSGLQHTITDNTNNPETGILPLIPDYLANETGIFSILSKQYQKSQFELGLRYDYIHQKALVISRTLPREVLRYQNNFQNWSGLIGWSYTLNEHASITANVGLANRNPAINELYSNGLHQGVSGIEEGNAQLRKEQSLKLTAGFASQWHHKFSLEALAYYQYFTDYIYLQPSNEYQLTIRGAFPLFYYAQTDARLMGIDAVSQYHFTPAFFAKLAFSYIRGDDLKRDIPLLFIPANNISFSTAYEFTRALAVGNLSFENLTLKATNLFVFRQHHLTASQDFLPPPPAYTLLSFNTSTDVQLNKIRFRFVVNIDNLLNVQYRDYLNRQRYFADDSGRNIALGVIMKF